MKLDMVYLSVISLQLYVIHFPAFCRGDEMDFMWIICQETTPRSYARASEVEEKKEQRRR